jgi:hypothetical protein
VLCTALLAVTSACGKTANSDTSAPTGTIFGTITAGPTCPVERAGEPCNPAPVAIDVAAHAMGRRVAGTRSATNGNYTLRLPEGRYELRATTNAALPRCVAALVTVTANRRVRADITCDTGIR